MKKILLVTMDFPPLIGGIANYYFNLVQKIPPENIVVLMDKIEGKKFRISDFGFRIYFRKFFSKTVWPHWLPLIWHIFKVAKKERVKILWAGQILPVGTAVIMVAKILKLPYFVTCHGNDLLRAKQHPRKLKLAQKILQGAEHVEANTKFTKNILIQDFDVKTEQIKVVYPENTLKLDMLNQQKVEEIKQKYNLAGKKVLLTVARLVESKGIDHVIQALNLVWQEIPNLVYLIVGEGPFKSKLEKNKKIIMVGQVEHSELPNYYALADAFILTPRKNQAGDTESFGIVYLEAAKFGLPIIAGRIGGVNEIVQKNDKINLVNSEDIKEIKDAIIKVLK